MPDEVMWRIIVHMIVAIITIGAPIPFNDLDRWSR